MDIVYCINNNYVPYIEVSICSLLDNNKEHKINIHVLINNISNENKKHLLNLVQNKYNQRVIFHIVDDTSLKELKDTWSIYIWYRLLIPDTLPNVDKCLYLDADTIIIGDISDLFNIDMTNKSIAAVLDIETLNEKRFELLEYKESSKYVCSGVMMMNLDFWRKNTLSNKIKSYAIDNQERIVFPDQDCINYICRDTKILLPLKYGILNAFILNKDFLQKYKNEIIELLEDPKIIHYAGLNPWIIEKNRHFMREYFYKYNKMIGFPVKSRHILTGMSLIRYHIKRILDYFHIIHFRPYYCTPIKKRNEILKSLKAQ